MCSPFAGSSILTSTHSFGQRRNPYKSAAIGSHAESSTQGHTLTTETQGNTPVVNGIDVELDSSSSHQKSRLAKPGSSATSTTSSSHSKLHHSSVSASNVKGGSDGHTHSIPSRSTSLSKLQSPSLMKKLKEPAKIEEKEEPPGDKPINKDGDAGGSGRPGSRLKQPSSGRSTPSNLSKSGLQRPSSRLTKPGFSGSATNEDQGMFSFDTVIKVVCV